MTRIVAQPKEAPFAYLQQNDQTARGAEWHRWDLHIHTPASYQHQYGDGQQQSTWDRYIGELSRLPQDIKAVGINDYFSVEGYRRVLDAHKGGLLPNLELILPVVEIRLTAFVGSAETGKLNFHVVFSDSVSPDHIDQFFLQRLNAELKLDRGEPWRGCLGNRAGLIDLGRAVRAATPDSIRSNHSELAVGFANAAVDFGLVIEAIEQSVFRDRVLTALGAGEWTQMRWEGAGTAQKRNAIERVGFVLTAAPSLDQYQARVAQFSKAGVSSRLIDASDAHHYADSPEPNRLGQGQTWIKADLTFQGLRRAVTRFSDRVFVGPIPPKLERVRQKRTKYIDRIEVRKKDGSSLREAWFDADLPLNHDLVAVIGNQGSGKSALTDIIALCGQTTTDGFGFLTPDKFRDRQKRASQFLATLTWADGQSQKMSLDQTPDRSSLERVRYIPQGFFQDATNETAVSESGKFYSEIKKAIYSHVPVTERLGCDCLDDLVAKHTEAAEDELRQLRAELKEINRSHQVLANACSPSVIADVDALIAGVEAQIAALVSTPPTEVTPPPESAEASEKIAALLNEAASVRASIDATQTQVGQRRRQLSAIDQALQSLRAEERRILSAVEKIARGLKADGVDIDVTSVLTVQSDFQAITAHRERLAAQLTLLEGSIDPERQGSLMARLRVAEAKSHQLQQESAAAATAYQRYLVASSAWRATIDGLRGDAPTPTPDSLAGLRLRRLELTETKPAAMKELEASRRAKCREIFRVLQRLAAVHEAIARPVREHIQVTELTREYYRLAFDVGITPSGLAERLFGMISQQSGSFSGVQQGQVLLRRLLHEADFSSEEGSLAFADRLWDHLVSDRRADIPVPVHLAGMLKKSATVADVLDLVYSLEYLRPTFELGLNKKPLRQLSPGERGILLLVFYLVVDLSDEPLIIDQPEGNLNNQSIVDHLVPVIKAAKARRQMIIVTHNPNIAVVCDAEQIIHCRMDQDGSHRIHYSAGAIENSRFNRLSLDLLEGTGRALDVRVSSYDRSEPRAEAVVLPVADWPV